MKIRTTTVIGFVLLAAVSRLLPHPPNVAPIMAMALFGGAYLANRRLAFLLPLAAMLLSDLVIGLHSQLLAVYAAFALIVLIGRGLQQSRTFARIAGSTLLGSVLFFVITNFGVWAVDQLYPKTWEGLAACYVAAIPFFRNALTGDVLYSALLFGGFELLARRIPALGEPSPASAS